MPAGGAKPKSKASGTEMIGKKEAVAEGEEDLYNGINTKEDALDDLEISWNGQDIKKHIRETLKKAGYNTDNVLDMAK
ncbi:MAG: hypothetical protein LBQ42_09015, partial [Synergistaceae bacterium]|nr:hypothetical protein [Synergistaceae bacterium]